MPWMHDYVFTHHKGKTKVTCKPCGRTSRWFGSDEHEQMTAWCNKHSGLLEKQRKVDA